MIKIGLIILNLLNTLQPFCLNGDEPVVQNGRDTSGDIFIVIGLIALIIILGIIIGIIRKKNNESFNQYRGFTNDIYAHDNHSTNDALPEIHRKAQDKR